MHEETGQEIQDDDLLDLVTYWAEVIGLGEVNDWDEVIDWDVENDWDVVTGWDVVTDWDEVSGWGVVIGWVGSLDLVMAGDWLLAAWVRSYWLASVTVLDQYQGLVRSH